MDRDGGGIHGSRYSVEDCLLGTDLRYGRFTGRTASDVKSSIPAYSDDSLRGYDDRDRNLFEEKYVEEKEKLMVLSATEPGRNIYS